MEKDINLILDVEPDEAQALIDLIELLFGEWYVAKHDRERKIEGIGGRAENKEEKKAQAKLSPPLAKLPAPGAWISRISTARLRTRQTERPERETPFFSGCAHAPRRPRPSAQPVCMK